MRLARAISLLALCIVAGCEAHGRNDVRSHGAELIAHEGCGLCHTIPGIADAEGRIGPPLEHIGSRSYIAGVLRNSPDNMVTWLRHPQKVVPGNAMPDMGLSEADARAITAYLDTLD